MEQQIHTNNTQITYKYYKRLNYQIKYSFGCILKQKKKRRTLTKLPAGTRLTKSPDSRTLNNRMAKLDTTKFVIQVPKFTQTWRTSTAVNCITAIY